MIKQFSWICLIACIILSVIAHHEPSLGDLDFKRVHLVDHVMANGTQHYFYRGNFPTDANGMQYKELMQAMGTRAKEAGLSFPNNTYVIDIAFNNVADDDAREREFWAENPELGEYINWPLGFAGLLPPSAYEQPKRDEMCKEGGKVWEWDLMPERVRILRSMLQQRGPIDSATGAPRPIAVYVHCSAGCDRTGQFVAAYRLNYKINATSAAIQTIYELNVNECGRPPNYYSTSSTEWYCVYWSNLYKRDVGDCLHLADCSFLGKCTWPPKNTTHFVIDGKRKY